MVKEGMLSDSSSFNCARTREHYWLRRFSAAAALVDGEKIDCWPRGRRSVWNRVKVLGWARCEGVGTAASKWSHPLWLLSDGPLRSSFTWPLIGKVWRSFKTVWFFDSILSYGGRRGSLGVQIWIPFQRQRSGESLFSHVQRLPHLTSSLSATFYENKLLNHDRLYVLGLKNDNELISSFIQSNHRLVSLILYCMYLYCTPYKYKIINFFWNV